jgi:hypothetical protein
MPVPCLCHALQLLEAGGLDRLLADPRAIKEAVVFAAATGEPHSCVYSL